VKLVVVVVLALAVGLAMAGPFASHAPDGLNRVAADQGFADRAEHRNAPFSGYDGLAGFVGTLVVFGVGYGVVRGARWRGSPST
jgi:hypothetical protein